MISKEDLDRVALLSRFELTGAERDSYTDQLNDLLGQIRLLDQLDTENVEPTPYILPFRNVYRGDQTGKHLPVEDALANSANHDRNYFIVPKIL